MATVDIELFYDLDRRRWTTSAGGLATQPSLFIGQSNDIDFKVRFVQGGVPIELESPTWLAGIKVTDDPLGDYLLLTTNATKTGAGSTTIYTFSLNIDSVELRAYLVGITPTTNSTAFEVRDTVNNIATLPAITCSILPDYTLTGATPAAGSGTLVVDSGATFTVHKSFAMPTTNGSLNWVLQTNGAGVGSWVAQSTNSGTVSNVAFTGGLINVANPTGSVAMTVAGTSGGIVYFGSGTTWATSGVMGAGALVVGGGAGATPTALAAVASGRVLTSAGTNTSPAYSSTITLGASGTLGTITLGNATSGTILITPPTGALGTPTLTLPITSTTLAGLAVVQTFTANQTFSGTIDIAATTSTAGQLTQAGTRLLHTYGTDNLFLGSGAGNFGATLGSNNIGIGKSSLAACTTGSSNTAIGRVTMTALTTGSNNVALGDDTGTGLTFGDYNILVGRNAGKALTTGSNNSAIGGLSLMACISGSSNVAIGYQSLGLNTSGANTAVGHNSGYYSTSSNGTYIGQSAGIATATVGGLAGVAITSGANNTMIGQASSSTSATGTYRTAIGSDSRCNNDKSIKLGRDHTASFVGDFVTFPTVLTANLPTATATMAGSVLFVSDSAGGGHMFFCNGSSWARIN